MILTSLRLDSRFALPLRNSSTGSIDLVSGVATVSSDWGTMVSDPSGFSVMAKKRYLAELQELKNLFAYCLPVGEHKDKADDYFNSLQKVIDTTNYEQNPEPIPREQFPDTELDVEYTYLKDAIPTEQRGLSKLRAYGQAMDDAGTLHEGQVPQCDGAISHDDAPVPEREATREFEYGEQDCDNSSW